MRFQEAVQGRRSIRAFEPRAIEDDKLSLILETVDAAPSAGNLQAYEVVVVKDPDTRQALSRAALGQAQVARAPVVLVFLAHPLRSAAKYGSRGADLYSVQDATIACAYAQLAATDLGLSSCWIGAFSPEPVVNGGGRIPTSSV